MPYVEYPKALYLHGWAVLEACVTVQDAYAEALARAGGYRMLSDPERAVDERDALAAALDAAGIEYDGRWGVARLRGLLGVPE